MSFDWQEPVTIKPIGYVSSPLKNFDQVPTYGEQAELVIREDLTEGLIGLEHFSHLHVVYRQHRREEWKRRAKIPEGTEALTMPLMGEPTCKGIYTSRSPARPSGMGSCIVELMHRANNRLIVRGLDAVDGTPLLDFKIYIPKYDCFPFADAPLHWCQKTPMLSTSRLLHWDTMNVGLTLGMRVGQRALHELSLTRGQCKNCTVHGGNFFGQGIEAVTGCSVMHGSMSFVEKPHSLKDWFARLESAEKAIEIHVNDQLYSGADEVLSLKDEHLFSGVEVTTVTRA